MRPLLTAARLLLAMTFVIAAVTAVIPLTACAQAGPAPGDSAVRPADETTKWHHFMDPRTGLAQYRTPIPQSWQVHGTDAPVYMTGPGGIKVHQTQQQQFGWSPDAFMRQSIQMTGQIVAPPMTVHEIVETQIRPRAESAGYRFVRTFAVPGVAGFWNRLIQSLPATGGRRAVQALGTEWESASGNRR